MKKWITERPTEPGFYYWQNHDLFNISKNCVRVVQVSKYKNRLGFHCETLTGPNDLTEPVFSVDIFDTPQGWWYGPLEQPK